MRWLPVLCLLAGCGTAPETAAPPGDRVTAVTLYRDTVTVALARGPLCAAVRQGRAGPWRGRLAGCAVDWPVRVLRPAERPRVPLAPTLTEPWVVLERPGGDSGYAPRGP